MNEETKMIEWKDNTIEYTFCVVYPKDLFAQPDEKAKALARDLADHHMRPYVVGIKSSPEQPINESMIMVYDAIYEKRLLFKSFHEYQKAINKMYNTEEVNEYGLFLRPEYLDIQNAYLATINSASDLPCKESNKEISEKLYDLLVDMRLSIAEDFRTKIINDEFQKQNRKNEINYESEYESEEDYARREGFYLDDDGHWIPFGC